MVTFAAMEETYTFGKQEPDGTISQYSKTESELTPDEIEVLIRKLVADFKRMPKEVKREILNRI